MPDEPRLPCSLCGRTYEVGKFQQVSSDDAIREKANALFELARIEWICSVRCAPDLDSLQRLTTLAQWAFRQGEGSNAAKVARTLKGLLGA